jgi:hypothetical protein
MGILVGVRLHPSLHEYLGCMPDTCCTYGFTLQLLKMEEVTR